MEFDPDSAPWLRDAKANGKPPLRTVGPNERAPRPKALEQLGPAEFIGTTHDISDRPPWMRALRWAEVKKDKDVIYTLMPTAGNVASILANDPRWAGSIRYNEFADRAFFSRPPPWHEDDCEKPKAGELVDRDANRLSNWFDRAYHIKIGVDACYGLLLSEADRNALHPVRDYLNSLKWDGVKRADMWLTTYFGVEDSPLHQAFASKFLISAVARVMRPGCKVDTVLILEGEQGLKKSTALEILAGGAEFFAELHGDLNDKDTLQMLSGKWIAEVSELSSMRKSDVESAKRFFSCRIDRYRPSFGRKVQDFPRQCVFAGSTNQNGIGYLTDTTGNRRFWPVTCTKIEREALRKIRDQLWAEALVRWKSDERWWLPPELETDAREAQELRLVSDEWEEPIETYLANNMISSTSVGDILEKCLKIEIGKWTLADQMRAGKVMTKFGWRRKRLSTPGRPWVYEAPIQKPPPPPASKPDLPY